MILEGAHKQWQGNLRLPAKLRARKGLLENHPFTPLPSPQPCQNYARQLDDTAEAVCVCVMVRL